MSTRSEEAAPSYRWPVFLCDNDPSRRDRILAALSQSSSIIVQPTGELSPRIGNFGAAIALSSPSNSQAELDLVRAYKKRGANVVCYCPGASVLPLCVRCKVLLAGGSDLLDCGQDQFEEKLRVLLEKAAVRESQREREHERLRTTMRRMEVVGESPALLSLFRTIERVSQLSDLPVLITGETGTGKELVAQAIYRQDPKRNQFAFVPLNCAALNQDLFESELFGHRRGAFTGAHRDRSGLFRAADGGVLFLDEIGDLNLSLQAKLLRALQTNRVLGVGEDRETAVDVRVIAATNRNLPDMVAAGSFREDLYYRLNVTPLHVPPLRERPGDILPLVGHFLHKYRHLGPNGDAEVRATPDFLRALERSALPGNARQLENLVRHALVAADGNRPLNLNDLPDEVWAELSAQEADSATAARRKPPKAEGSLLAYATECLEQNGWNLSKSLAQLEETLLRAALEASHGNRTETARRLGITARSIYNKLHRRSAS